MRTIFILRGCPASGKSYWVKENGLEPYTLSADFIRLLHQSPIVSLDGGLKISQEHDREVWDMLLELLEARMCRGEFIVIDATHYRNTLIASYKNLIHKYRYRAYVVDFSDVPLETILERNRSRDRFRYVPEEHIKKVYSLLKVKNKPQSYAKLITREDALKLIDTNVFDYNNYDKVVVFGDIHGCYEPLKKWFDDNPFDPNTAYIFIGDYTDRGLQNKEVLELLINLSSNRNVLLLEGNHEKWLRLYCHDEDSINSIPSDDMKVLKRYDKRLLRRINSSKIHNKEFINNTVPQIKSISKKDLKVLCDRLGQMAYIDFRGNKVFICHGGIPVTPTIFTPSYQMIKGVGKYEDTYELYKSWLENTNDVILVHGHRNVLGHPVKVNERIYNLCDTVEFGGCFRVLELCGDGDIKTHEIKNDYFKVQDFGVKVEEKDSDIITKLNSNPRLINRKDFGKVSSYNFTSRVFRDRLWDDITCKARGLFVDNDTREVVMRSYDKFYNMKEVEATKLKSLKTNLVFPMDCYRKENGFLAMITWYDGNIMFGSKSTIEGTYVEYIKEVFYNDLTEKARSAIIDYVKGHNQTMVFECVHKEDNTHPIWYTKNHLYLLDIIDNSFEFTKVPYDMLKKFADKNGIEVKVKLHTFNSFDNFYSFKKSVDSESPNAKEPTFEGFVFEDASGFMFKYKLPFYRYWKEKRAYLSKLQHNRQEAEATAVFREERDVKVFGMLSKVEDVSNLTIVDVEKLFYGDKLVAVDCQQEGL